jgi:hypothetical protein
LLLNIFAKPDGVKARLMPRRKQVPVRIFARPDRGTAQSARSRLKDVVNVDRTAAVTSTAGAIAEIATLRQKLAAASIGRIEPWKAPEIVRLGLVGKHRVGSP